MGSPIANWADAVDVIYTGGGSSEMIWFLAALALCILAIIWGGAKESSSYK